MKASKTLLEHIKQSEGLRLTAYKPKGEKDTGARLTIGYGHFGAKAGQTITEKEAEALLIADIEAVERQLARLPLSHLTQGQWDAVVDFCFNLGYRAFISSTLYRKITDRRPTTEIQAEFRKWVYSGKTRLAGLVKRREWEAQMWAKG